MKEKFTKEAAFNFVNYQSDSKLAEKTVRDHKLQYSLKCYASSNDTGIIQVFCLEISMQAAGSNAVPVSLWVNNLQLACIVRYSDSID